MTLLTLAVGLKLNSPPQRTQAGTGTGSSPVTSTATPASRR